MATVIGDLLVKLRGDTAQFAKSMEGASARINKFGSKMTQVGKSIGMGLSLPLLGVGVAAVKMSADLDMTLSRVVGLVGRTRSEVAEWREELLGLSVSVGKSTNELAEALFFVTSAGIRGKDVMLTVAAAARGASAGLGETAVVADAATSAMNAFASSNMTAEQAVSILVATVREGKAEAASLAPVLGRVMPIAANLGVSFDQVGAAMAAMTRLGFNAEISVTALRATLMQIAKVTPAQEKAAADLGLSFAKLRKTVREDGLIAALTMLKEKVGDSETAMTAIFPNARAVSGVLAMVGDNAEATQKIFKSLAETTGKDLADAFGAAEEQAGFKFKQALVAVQNLLIRIGDEILPKLVPQVEALTERVEGWTQWVVLADDATKGWGLKLAGLAIILAPIVITIGLFAKAIAGIVAVAGGLMSALGYVGAMGTAFGGLTGAVTLATGAAAAFTLGLAALVGGAAYVITSAIQPWINKVTGLNNVLDLAAGKHKDLVSGLAESKKAYEDQLYAYNRMKKSLGLVGDEWEVQAEHTEKNAFRLSRLTDKVIELAKKESELKMRIREVGEEATKQADDAVTGTEAMEEALAEATAAETAYLDQLKEKYDVLGKDDIVEQMVLIGREIEAMKGNISDTQIAENLNEPMLKLATLAKEAGVEVPAIFRKGAESLGKHLAPGIQNLIDTTYAATDYVNKLGKEIEGIFWTTGEESAKALTNGFTKGVDNGIEHGTVAFDAWVQRIEDTIITIEPQLSLDGWNRAVEDAMEGRAPREYG